MPIICMVRKSSYSLKQIENNITKPVTLNLCGVSFCRERVSALSISGQRSPKPETTTTKNK